MHITLQALVLAALAFEGAVAQPAHRHAHLHKRSLRDVLTKRWGTPPGGWNNPSNYANVDWSKVDYSGGKQSGESSPQTSPSAPAVEQKSAVKPSSGSSEKPATKPSGGQGQSASNGGSGSCSDLSDVFKSGDSSSQGPTAASAAKAKRATYQQDTYVGNTGAGKYGSNMKPESDCKASGSYSLKFTNNMGSDEDFWLWNKIGADGKMDGMMKNAFYKFHLSKGQSAVFSVESNTQTAFSQACGRAASNGNVPNCNIGEANFDDQNSHGGSFYDVSMVTYNDIKAAGGSPNMIPMTIKADGYDESTASNCVYTQSSQNSPVQPGSSGKCAMGPIDASPFHVNVVYG